MLGEDLGRLESVSEEETSEVVELGLVDDFLDLGRLEVLGAERLGGSKGGAERPEGTATGSVAAFSYLKGARLTCHGQ